MDVQVTEEQILSLAYQLYEEAGSPEGRSDEFWKQAQNRLMGELAMEVDGLGSPDRTRRPEMKPP